MGRAKRSIKHVAEVEKKVDEWVQAEVEKQSVAEEKKSVGLLNIPGEIRNQIYRLTIPTGEVMASVKPNPHGQQSPQDVLAATCKQIRQEVLSIYYGENTFKLAHDGIDMGPHAVMVRPFDFNIRETHGRTNATNTTARARFLIQFRLDGTIRITLQQVPGARRDRCDCVKHAVVSAPTGRALNANHFWDVVKTLKKINEPYREQFRVCENCFPYVPRKVNWGVYKRITALISSGGQRWEGVKIGCVPEEAMAG